jgi:hypothetical protein
MLVRGLTTAGLALLLLVPASGEASAGYWSRHRHHRYVPWPKVFVPTITGNLFDSSGGDTYDNGGYAPEAYNNDPNADSLDPVYAPPAKKKIVPKPVKKVATRQAAPKVKPIAIAATTTSAPVTHKPLASAPLTLAAGDDEKSTGTLSPSLPLVKKPAPVTSAATKVASLQPSGGGSIACSKGAEIVSGYGFTSVKSKACTGTTYSFDAARGASAYVIKLSAATGEITDVQKLK